MTTQPTPQDTVLVIRSTGNVGVSAVIGALRSDRDVLAAVRNEASAAKLFHHIRNTISDEDRKRITTVEVDVTSDQGVQSIVDKAKRGELPAFQHVYTLAKSTVKKMLDISIEELRRLTNVNFESNFLPYLQEQHSRRDTTVTMCSCALTHDEEPAVHSLFYGALHSMSWAACHDLEESNVRFNEVYLDRCRVAVDDVAAESVAMEASYFAKVYHQTLDGGADSHLKSCRIYVVVPELHVEKLQWEQQISC